MEGLRLLVVVNPISGWRFMRRVVLPIILSDYEKKGVECTTRQTRYVGHAARIVEREAAAHDVVVVVGGDGTIAEVVRGMDGCPRPLAIIPCGTANVLALELGIPLNPFLAAQVVLTGRKRLIDVGRINDRPFLLMVSAGIDAFVVHNLNHSIKRYLGKMAYVLTGMASLFSYRARRVRVTIESGNIQDRGYFAIVANSRRYGGRFSVEPEAAIDDGVLNVLLFKKPSVLDTLGLLFGVLTGTHKSMRDVVAYRAESVVMSSRRKIYMQTDGDKVPFTRAKISVERRSLSVLVPRRARPSEGGENRSAGSGLLPR
jgi:YegS/Rv2252/BmrU family lipid kinase